MSDASARAAVPLPHPLAQRRGDVVYQTLKRAIIVGEREPGAPLLEQHLATELGCSQGTVREALLRLEQEGLVTRRGYRGSFVSETSAAEAALMVHLRIRIESEGIRRAARDVAEPQLENLSALIREMEEAADRHDFFAFSETDRNFHGAILEISGLVALDPVLRRCSLHMHRFTLEHTVNPTVSRATASQHWDVLEALASRDPDTAAEAVRAHIESVIELSSPVLFDALTAGAEVELPATAPLT